MKQNTDIASGAPRLHGAGRQTMCGSTPQRYEKSRKPEGYSSSPSYTTNKKGTASDRCSPRCGDPGEARTHDPVIKSHLLYQLSYRVIDL